MWNRIKIDQTLKKTQFLSLTKILKGTCFLISGKRCKNFYFLKRLNLTKIFSSLNSSDRNNFLFFGISTLNSTKLTIKPKVVCPGPKM